MTGCFRPGQDREEGGACRPLVVLLLDPTGDEVTQRTAAFGAAGSIQGNHLKSVHVGPRMLVNLVGWCGVVTNTCRSALIKSATKLTAAARRPVLVSEAMRTH